ncbi:mucin-22-like [Thunnus thynnus]|uniref:mucin-22-like n=1 Tax=Thunnus thynnus TaxID=8237 RepID=UPI00352916BE
MSFCAPSNTAAFRRKLIQDKTVSFQEGNLNMGADQIQSYIDTVQQTPLFYPLPETVTTVGSIRVQNNSPLTSINTSKLIGYQSENKSENQRTGALSDKTEMESMMINRFSSLVEDKVQAINLETIEVGFKEGTNTNTEITETVTGADVKQESHFITQTTVTDPSSQTLAEVVIQTETAELDCTEGYVHDSNQDPAQVVSLTLDTQAEVVSDDNNREEVEVKVEGTSLVHGLDKSLSLCDKSKSKQNDVKEDAVVGFGLLTASSCSTNSDDILVRESKTASAETLRKSMTINRWSSLLEDKVHSVDPVLLNQSIVGIQISQDVEERSNLSLKLETQAEVVKDACEVAVRAFEVSGSEGVQDGVSCEVTLMDEKNREEVEVEVEGTSLLHGLDQSLSLCDESNSKQKDVTEDADVGSGLLSASSCSANSDDILVRENKTASAEALRKSLTINRWSSLLEGNVHSTDPDLLDKLTVGIQISQDVEERSIMSLKLETQAEVVKDEGKVAVTAFEVSGSEGVQAEVSCEVTLMDDKNREEVEVEVEGTSLVLGLDQSLSLCDESNSKQKDMKEDADEGSDLATATSCNANSDDILVKESKTASAEALRKSMTINRWSSLLEGNVHSTDPDLLDKSIVGTQISQGVEERSVVSLKLETQAEVIKDAGQVDVRAFEVSGSEGVQAEVSCEVTLMDDKNREEVEVEVEGTSLVLGLDQSLSLCDESNSKQKDMKEDADEGSDLATATSCNANSDDILVKESKTASAEALRKSMTINRWSSLLEGNVLSTDPDLLDKLIVGTQISQGVEERSVVSLKLETQAEVVKDAGQVDVRAFEVSGSEGVQAEVSCEVTLMDDKNREEVEVEVEGTSLVLGLDQSSSLCDESNSKQKDMKEDADVGSGLPAATSCSANSDDILVREGKTASAEALRKSMTINRWSSLLEGNVHSTDPDLLNKSIVGTQISQGVEERSVVSLKLETQAEVVRDTGEVAVTAFEVSGSEGVQSEVSCEVTLMDDKSREEVEIKVEGTSLVHGLDQSLSLCDESNSKQNDVKEDADVGSSLLTASSCSTNNDDILVREGITASAETLRKTMTINRWSSLLEDKVHLVDPDLPKKTMVGTQISQGVEERSNLSLKLETQAEVVKDEDKVAITAFEVSGSEGVQGEVSCEVTLMDDKNREEIEVEVESTSLVHGLDKNLSFCDVSNSKQNNIKEDADAGPGLLIASPCISDRNDNLNTKSINASAETLRKSITVNRWSSLLEPKVHSIDPLPTIDLLNKSIVGTQISQGVEERSVVMSSKTEINTTIGITSSLPNTQPVGSAGVQDEPESFFLKQTTMEVKATETAQIDCTEDYVHAKNENPAQVVSLKLETQAGVVRDAGEVVVTTFEVTGSEGVQGEVSCEVTLMDDENREEVEVEVEGTSLVRGLDQSFSLCDESNSKQNKVKEDVDVGFSLPTASPCKANSDDILVRESTTVQSKEIMKEAELEVNREEVVTGFHVTNGVKLASLTDCGVILSSCDDEEPLSTTVPVACPIETEVCPIDPKMNLSQNDPETCLSKVEAKVCLSLTGEEEDDKVCLNLTEASVCVRPVEKYILSTKEESQYISSSRGQALLDTDRNRKVTTSVKNGSSLHFESFDGSSVGSLETRHGSEDQTETPNMDSKERGQISSECLVDSKADDSFGNVPAPGGTSFRDAEGKMSGMDCSRGGMAARFDDTTANSAGTVGGDTDAVTTSEIQGEIRLDSEEWMVQGGNRGRSKLPRKESEESLPVATLPATSQPGTGRFGKKGSGEWIVYGGSIGRKSSLDGNGSLPNTGSEDSPSVATQLATKTSRKGRFGSTGSGEWRVYGGSTGSLSSGSGSERVRVSTSSCKIITTPGNQMGSGNRVSSAGSVLRRSNSQGSAEKLSSSGSGGKLSSSSGNHMISISGKFSTGSGESKPVYSSASGHKSSVGSGGQPGRGKTTTRHRTHSPAERRSVSGGSGGWLSSSSAGGNRISSTGSGSKLSGSGSIERINSRGGGRGMSSPRLGRANSAGGRVITSSNGPVRSTGSGAGNNHERISVCKMAALSMSAAGRERSQERQRQAQRSAKQEASASPLIQRWLTSTDEVPLAEPDGLDDIIQP